MSLQEARETVENAIFDAIQFFLNSYKPGVIFHESRQSVWPRCDAKSHLGLFYLLKMILSKIEIKIEKHF